MWFGQYIRRGYFIYNEYEACEFPSDQYTSEGLREDYHTGSTTLLVPDRCVSTSGGKW